MKLTKNVTLKLHQTETVEFKVGDDIEVIGGCFVTGNYLDILHNGKNEYRVNAGFFDRILSK